MPDGARDLAVAHGAPAGDRPERLPHLTLEGGRANVERDPLCAGWRRCSSTRPNRASASARGTRRHVQKRKTGKEGLPGGARWGKTPGGRILEGPRLLARVAAAA